MITTPIPLNDKISFILCVFGIELPVLGFFRSVFSFFETTIYYFGDREWSVGAKQLFIYIFHM